MAKDQKDQVILCRNWNRFSWLVFLLSPCIHQTAACNTVLRNIFTIKRDTPNISSKSWQKQLLLFFVLQIATANCIFKEVTLHYTNKCTDCSIYKGFSTFYYRQTQQTAKCSDDRLQSPQDVVQVFICTCRSLTVDTILFINSHT